MKPILFKTTETNFNNNGIGILSDAVSCFVTEERNGTLELEMEYPIDGIHYKEIKQRSIITAKAHADGNAQPFRVYRITKPLNGIVTIYAEHISYDLSGIAVTPFSAGSAAAALQALKTNSVVENPFEFWTDKSTVAEMNVKTPASIRAMLGGVQGSVLDTYGGEYEWDGFTVKLHNERGRNRGVSIRYGKNLTDLEQEENCANVYTAVMPFWADNEGNNVLLQERIVNVSGNFDFVRVLTLDLSSEFDAQPSQDELRNRAQKYIDDNNIGVPKVSLRISFVPLEQTEEYKNIALLERVNLCDTVNVEFEKLGVSATAKVVKTVFDVLLDRYKSVELGDARSNIADTLIKQEQAIKDAPKKAVSLAAQAAENATQLITGNRGGYVVIHSSTGSSQPDEILIMDKPTIEEATKVWRWNNSGLGYSETGYSGTYTTAWTIDGAFNADFITAGTISANLIKSGLLKSLNERTTLDMDSGMLSILMDGETENDSKMVVSRHGLKFLKNNQEAASYTSFGARSNSFIVYDETKAKDLAVLGASSYVGEAGGFGLGTLSLLRESDSASSVSLTAQYEGGGKLDFIKWEGNSGTSLAHIGANDTNGGKIELREPNGNIIAQLKNKAGSGGQLELRNESGKATFSFSNSSGGGAECWIGEGNNTYKIFDYRNGKKRIFVEELNLYGKTRGLINFLGSSSATADSDEYSAFLVCGIPASGRRQSTVLIPSARTGNYQIADEDYYLDISYKKSSISKAGGSSGAAIQAIYGIR